MIVSNLELDSDLLRYKYKKPFDMMAFCNETSNWLALANELRTASMSYDESEIRNIKGLLLDVA